MRYRPDGSQGQIYARGLRNAVGITFRPGTDELWVTNNGRDMMGDDQPPETIYRVQEGRDYGWPRCHSGRIADPESAGGCLRRGKAPARVAGAFCPAWFNFLHVRAQVLIVAIFAAYHGSWNRSQPTGYKVVHRWKMPSRSGEDFAVGWLGQIILPGDAR
jgi:glucose/arabinose dehydrogenase